RRGPVADHRGDPVPLQPEPLQLVRAEVVVVVDDRGWFEADPPARRLQAQREIDVLVVEEELSGESAGPPPRFLTHGQAGSRGNRDLAGRTRLPDGSSVTAGPGYSGVVDRVGPGVDAALASDPAGDQGHPRIPVRMLG